MITRELMSARFIEWENNIKKDWEGKADIFGEVQPVVGLANDKTTGERILTAYALFFNFRVRVIESKTNIPLIYGIYQIHFFINFEKGKTKRNDLMSLFKDAHTKFFLAFKNKIRPRAFDFTAIEFDNLNPETLISKLFYQTLPSNNLI